MKLMVRLKGIVKLEKNLGKILGKILGEQQAGRVFLLSKKKVATTTRKWAAVNPDLPEICSQKRLVSEEDADEKAKKLKAGKKEEKGVENRAAEKENLEGVEVREAEQDRNINIK